MSDETEVVKTPADECEEIVRELQAIKAPLDKSRTTAQQNIKKLKLSVQDKIQALKEEVREGHAKIAPLDNLMTSAMAAKRLKGNIQNQAIKTIKKELDRLKAD